MIIRAFSIDEVLSEIEIVQKKYWPDYPTRKFYEFGRQYQKGIVKETHEEWATESSSFIDYINQIVIQGNQHLLAQLPEPIHGKIVSSKQPGWLSSGMWYLPVSVYAIGDLRDILRGRSRVIPNKVQSAVSSIPNQNLQGTIGDLFQSFIDALGEKPREFEVKFFQCRYGERYRETELKALHEAQERIRNYKAQ